MQILQKYAFPLSCGLLMLLGAGCTGEPTVSIQSVQEQKGVQSSEKEASATDIATWKQEASIKGIQFSYPPKLQYEEGGGTDGFTRHWIGTSDETYFGITEFVLQKCAPAHDPGCGLDEMVAATPAEVSERQVRDAVADEYYTAAGEVSIAGVTGKKFVRNALGKDFITKTKVIFAVPGGAYIVEDVRADVTDDDLFNLFLGTIVSRP